MKPLNISNRIAYLDVLRIVACLLVCANHAQLLYWGAERQTHTAAVLSTMVRGANLFFLISGALLLPVAGSWREFIPRRVSRVGWPLLVWTVVYVINGFCNGTVAWRDVLMLPMAPASGFLWYTYVMIVVYLLMPAVSVAIEAMGKRGVQVYLVLWVLSSLIPFEHGVITSLTPPQHPLAMFHNCYGYVVLGYYLRRWPLPLFTWRHGWWIALVMVLGMVAVPWFEFTCQPDLSWHDHYLAIHNKVSIIAVMETALLFTVVQRLVPERYSSQGRVPAVVATVSNCTFGIYLMHMVLMEHVTTIPTNALLLNYASSQAGQILIICVVYPIISFMLCLLLTWLLMKLPCSRYIVGR